MIRTLKYTILLVFICLSFGLQAQKVSSNKPLTRILFLFDASQSMYGTWQSDRKMYIARRLLSNAVDSLSKIDNLEMGLRVYGHQHKYPPKVCDDTRLEVGFAKDNAAAIKHELSMLNPRGTSPIAYSLLQTANDFPPCENCRNVVVLITDGIEECGGDPCAVSQELQEKGVFLSPFVVGIGRSLGDSLNCIGTYFDAESETHFRKALEIIISKALNPTSAQVNLLDERGYAIETNVSMIFYDHVSGIPKYNLVHTMNDRGNPDTLSIDPLINYDLVVSTLPPVRKNNISLVSGEHNIIAVNAPQGYLNLKIGGLSSVIKDILCIVRQKGKPETVNVHPFGSKEKYLTGLYDLEVLCMPRIYINDVKISQSHTTTVEIPFPGIVVLKKAVSGYGSIYQIKDNQLNWVYNFRENTPQQESLILQPGRYVVVFRSKNANNAFYTIERKFIVRSGKTTDVKL